MPDDTPAPRGSLPAKNAVELAQRLGWEVAKGKAAMALGQTMALVVEADRAGTEVLESSSAYQKDADQAMEVMEKLEGISATLSGLLLGQQTAVSGTYRGRSVLAIPQGHTPKGNRQTQSMLNMMMMFSQPLGLQLHIYPESLASKAGKLLLRLQDVTTGNQELDPLLMIKAKDESAAQRKLDRPSTQEALLTLFGKQPFACYPQCNDIALRVTVYGDHTVDHLVELLEALADLADALEES